MNKSTWFLVLLLQVFTISVFPQYKQIFGIGPVDWGASKEEVKEIMLSSFDLKPGYEKDDAVGFQGGKYFGENMHIWVFFFDEDKLNEVDFVVDNNGRPLNAIFYEVVHNLSGDYGDPELFKPDDLNAEWFYYDSEGKNLTATIKVTPYSNDKMNSIKISFIKI